MHSVHSFFIECIFCELVCRLLINLMEQWTWGQEIWLVWSCLAPPGTTSFSATHSTTPWCPGYCSLPLPATIPALPSVPGRSLKYSTGKRLFTYSHVPNAPREEVFSSSSLWVGAANPWVEGKLCFALDPLEGSQPVLCRVSAVAQSSYLNCLFSLCSSSLGEMLHSKGFR